MASGRVGRSGTSAATTRSSERRVQCGFSKLCYSFLMSRVLLPLLCCAILSGQAMAGPEQTVLVVASDKNGQACLSDSELRDEIAANRAIPQANALRAARSAVPAEPVRARLCRHDGALVYIITALAKDGKVTRITLDAETGRVVGQR